jgi:quinol monooxygenase YgiN
MRPFLLLVRAAAIAAASLVQFAHAEGGAVYLATYVDVMPNAAASGSTLLTHYRDASRKEDGNLRFDVLQEIARPTRFAIVEAWKDKAALDAHTKAAATAEFRDRLKAIQNAPYDERVTSALYVGRGESGNSTGAVYAVTHVDVIPPGKDDCMAALQAMSIATAKEPGNISYEVLQQGNRPNHFTVVEAWSSREALDAHAMAAHTRAFREKLAPIGGALYDERFYKALS